MVGRTGTATIRHNNKYDGSDECDDEDGPGDNNIDNVNVDEGCECECV